MPYSNEPPKSFLVNLWGFVDSSRRFLMNLLFLIILIVIGVAMLKPGGLKVKDKTALVLDIDGRIVEQYSGSARDQILQEISGGKNGETQLRDILAVLDKAAQDEKITSLYLRLDDFSGTGLSTLREVAAAINQFKKSGKKVVAWGAGFDQPAYYLAAHADEIYIHPMGGVLLQGFGRYRNYYKDALDRLGIQANVVRAGKFKNFGEPYFTNAPSKETLESDKYLYDGLWATYTSEVERARKLPAGAINKGIDEVNARLKAVNGDFAKLALDAKLVTAIKSPDEMRAMMIERGAKNGDQDTFRQVSMSEYATLIKPALTGDAIGVVVAEGEIGDGIAGPGKIGGRSTANLIRSAREDESVKAILLRVNSPGGSAYGSELIRRELELTRQAGKPVVVSMGSVAASGGYWISMAADEVIADAATITGSIGVFGMLPTGERAMEKLSLHTGGYSTTWLGGAMYDPRRPLDPRMTEIVQFGIDRIYTDFTTKAAAFRKTTPDKIDEIAQGRVWTGAQAKERGLVDRTGSFVDAINAAKSRAKLDDKAKVRYIETERSKFEQLLAQFGGGAAVTLADKFIMRIQSALPFTNVTAPAAVKDVQRDLLWLSEIAERGKTGIPFAAVVHCLCEAP
jgi:protease IV